MTLSNFQWLDANQENLSAEHPELGSVAFPAVAGHKYYDEFLASGETAADYVAPPDPSDPTPEEKLAASGLTVDELKALLGL